MTTDIDTFDVYEIKNTKKQLKELNITFTEYCMYKQLQQQRELLNKLDLMKITLDFIATRAK